MSFVKISNLPVANATVDSNNTIFPVVNLETNITGKMTLQTISTLIGGGANLRNWIVKTENYTALPSDRIIANTSNGSFTITLPASPASGDMVVVADGDNWANTNLIIARNNSTIDGFEEDFLIDIGNIQIDFIYDGNTWLLFTTITSNNNSVISAGEYSSDNLSVNTVNTVSNILFNKDAGFRLIDQGNQIIKIDLDIDYFKTINVAGQNDLVANGGDTLTVVAGNNIVLTTNSSSEPGQLTITSGMTIQDIPTTNFDYYPLFTNVTSGLVLTQNVSSTKLKFNPNTSTITLGAGNTISTLKAGESINTNGSTLAIAGGNTNNGIGGNVTITATDGVGTAKRGGSIVLLAGAGSGADGGNVSISAGLGSYFETGGTLVLKGGDHVVGGRISTITLNGTTFVDSLTGGDISIDPGSRGNDGGDLFLRGANATFMSARGGAVYILAGGSGGGGNGGGEVRIRAGYTGQGVGGNVIIEAGESTLPFGSANSGGGSVLIKAGETGTAQLGNPYQGRGGSISLVATNAYRGNNPGGNVTITAGNSTGTGLPGRIQLQSLTSFANAIILQNSMGNTGETIVSQGDNLPPIWRNPLIPRINTQTYSANVVLNWATADLIRIILTGDVEFTHTGAVDGQKIILEIKQPAASTANVYFTAQTKFGTDLPSFIASPTPGVTDKIGFIYNSAADNYRVLAISRGF